MVENAVDFRTDDSFIGYLIRNNLIDTPMLLVLKKRNFDMINFSYNHMSMTHNVCVYCDLDVIKFFFERKINIDLQTETGFAPIHFACLDRDATVIKYLIYCGVKLDCEISFYYGRECKLTVIDCIKDRNHILTQRGKNELCNLINKKMQS